MGLVNSILWQTIWIRAKRTHAAPSCSGTVGELHTFASFSLPLFILAVFSLPLSLSLSLSLSLCPPNTLTLSWTWRAVSLSSLSFSLSLSVMDLTCNYLAIAVAAQRERERERERERKRGRERELQHSRTASHPHVCALRTQPQGLTPPTFIYVSPPPSSSSASSSSPTWPRGRANLCVSLPSSPKLTVGRSQILCLPHEALASSPNFAAFHS